MDESKKTIRKGKEKKPKKEKKTKTKGKKGTRKQKKILEVNPFVQRQEPSKAPSAGGVLGGSKDLFGAGGLPSFLEALGVKGKFQSLGGTSGFAPQQPLNAPIARPQYAEPKLQERTIVKEPTVEISPQETMVSEEKLLKKLERANASISKEDLIQKVDAYFGNEGLDYVIKDEILQFKTKKGILRKMAQYAEMGYGNIDIDEFNNFTLFIEDIEDAFSKGSTVPVQVGGEGTSVLGQNGFIPDDSTIATNEVEEVEEMPEMEEVD
jgi:hypothetical protein